MIKRVYLKLVFFYGLSCTVVFIIIYMIIISIAPNAIVLNYDMPFKNEMNALAPQGWAFFTKDVHKDYFNLYEMKDNRVQMIYLKSAEISQYLGIKRENRVINHRINTVVNGVDSILWYTFKGDIKNVPIDSLSKLSIKIKEPMVYGVFLVEKGNPLPYDWYKSKLKIERTMKYIQLEIKK